MFNDTNFNAFSDVIKENGIIAGLCVTGADRFSRKQIDKITDYAKSLGAKGLVWLKHHEDNLEGPIVKFLSDEEINEVIQITKSKSNNIIFIIAGEEEETFSVLGELRLHLAEYLI